MKNIYFNEDNEHFYHCHTADEMTQEGVRSLVDRYAQTGTIRGILFCTNLQRALFDSNVWERFRDVDTGKPYEYRDHLKLLSERGVDHLKIWLERSAELGIEGWLTMRMNDSHGLKEASLGNTDCVLACWPSRKWRENPQLRRAPYRLERSWEGSYNYLLPEVREHHLALIRELFERYDMFGFECDWMRWGMMFPPGFEREGQKVLTGFVSEIRRLADEAEKRRGHRILLAHRVPAHPESCLNHGFDLLEWGKRGCVDMVTLSSFLGNTNYDPQTALWRAVLPPRTILNMYVEQCASAYPGNTVLSDDMLRGAAAAAWSAGVDGLYLFNECYRETKHLDELNELLTAISDPDKLAKTPYRTAVTFPQAIIAGESNRTTLPVPLIQKQIGIDLGRMEENITLRLPAGKIGPESSVYLSIAFSSDTDPEKLKNLPIRINTTPLDAGTFRRLPGDRVIPGQPFQQFADFPRDAAVILTCPVPAGILHETFNAVEILPPQIPGKIVWASLEINWNGKAF